MIKFSRNIYKLSGNLLMFEVHNIFRSFGGEIVDPGGKDTHDGIVHYKKYKFVLEIKSHETKGALLKDLRQLDDYVFTLSGEEKMRKERPEQVICLIWGKVHIEPSSRPPDPHRGVFIINHCYLKKERCNPFHHNIIKFAEKRALCLIDWPTFLNIKKKFDKGILSSDEIFEKIYNTWGILQL